VPAFAKRHANALLRAAAGQRAGKVIAARAGKEAETAEQQWASSPVSPTARTPAVYRLPNRGRSAKASHRSRTGEAEGAMAMAWNTAYSQPPRAARWRMKRVRCCSRAASDAPRMPALGTCMFCRRAHAAKSQVSLPAIRSGTAG